MGIYGNPRNLTESLGLSMNIFRLFGLFPFHFDAVENKFTVSRKLLVVTVLHISIFTYANVSALMENWHNYAQPLIAYSPLAVFGNLVFRLYDILISFLILGPPLIASSNFVSFLNVYMKICDEIVLLNIDISSIYRRMYYISIIYLFALAVLIVLTGYHSVYFYQHITQQPPDFKFYLVATLADLYKRLYLFYGNLHLISIYVITEKLNCFINNILKQYKCNYESGRFLKYAWLKPHKEENLKN